MPCASQGVIMPSAGSCPAVQTQATSGQRDASGQRLIPSEGVWVCDAAPKNIPEEVASFSDCRNGAGRPFCSCYLKFSEGCGAEQSTTPIGNNPVIASCKIGEGVVQDAKCPSGSGTGKATWHCTSLDPSERVAVCSCTLELKATDVCAKCNDGKPDPSQGSQCNRVSSDDNLVLESAIDCGLQSSDQNASLRCPEGTAEVGNIMTFSPTWKCFSR